MRNTKKALVLLWSVAALCACDGTGATVDSGPIPGTGMCDGIEDGLDGICPCPTVANGGTRYLFCQDQATWTQAQERCVAAGYQLLRVNDAAEQDFVFPASVETIGESEWWIGATDTAEEGAFVWTDGTPVDFAPWAEEQPDAGDGLVEEDCIEIHGGEAGHWNDLDCGTDYLDFICEGPA